VIGPNFDIILKDSEESKMPDQDQDQNQDQATPLDIPKSDKYNVQGVKRYVFNETGNIMMVTTDETSDVIQQQVRDVFAEVAVFFVAMTKAISTTPNPEDDNKPYSLYNYTALQRVIDGSGMFVHVTESDVSHTNKKFGLDFSKELLEGLLGLATGAGALAFASAMIASVGKEGLRIQNSNSKVDSKVANIVFVCEYLMGMPSISVIVISAEVAKLEKAFSVGPCIKSSKESVTIEMHKDTYMFVTPTFIKRYAGELMDVETDTDYTNFIDYLKVMGTPPPPPSIEEVMQNGKPIKDGKLAAGTTYAINGVQLGDQQRLMVFADQKPDSSVKITPSTWSAEKIEFTVSGEIATPSPIEIHLSSGTITTKNSYSVVANNDKAKDKAEEKDEK